MESEKRDSNPRPQPWQGCALPAELFSQFNVRMKGLEPPRLTTPDPKSCVATNYTTSAKIFFSLLVSANIKTFYRLKQKKSAFFIFFEIFKNHASFSLLNFILLHL